MVRGSWLSLILVFTPLVGCTLDSSIFLNDDQKSSPAPGSPSGETLIPSEKLSGLSITLTSDNWPYYSDPTPVVSVKGIKPGESLIVSYSSTCDSVAAHKKAAESDNGFVRLELPRFEKNESQTVFIKTQDACTALNSYQYRPVEKISNFSGVLLVQDSQGYVSCLGDCMYLQKSLPAMRNYQEIVTRGSTSVSVLFAGGQVKTFGYNDSNFTPVPDPQPTNVTQLVASARAYAALKSDGTVVAWGDSAYGGDASAVSGQLTSVAKLFSAGRAFAALKVDGSVVAWGDAAGGGTAPALADVVDIVGNFNSFVALMADGSAVPWGDAAYGGSAGAKAASLVNIVEIVPNGANSAYAALKSDGSVIAWGNTTEGGDTSNVAANLTGGVSKIVGNARAFCGYKSATRSAVCWGYVWSGGTSPAATGFVDIVADINHSLFLGKHANGSVTIWPSNYLDTSMAKDTVNNVKKVVGSSSLATYVLRNDGRVVTWGDTRYAGDASYIDEELHDIEDIFQFGGGYVAQKKDGSFVIHSYNYPLGIPLAKRESFGEVKKVVGTRDHGAFAVLNENGKLVTWGEAEIGGNESTLSSDLGQVSMVAANSRGFFAHLFDQNNLGWGFGGHSSAVAGLNSLLTDIVEILTSRDAFLARKSNGEAFSWGDSSYGGGASWTDIAEIKSNEYAFAGRRNDGGVNVRGNSSYGGSTGNATGAISNVVELAASSRAFAARKSDNTVVVWGNSSYGQNTTSVAGQLTDVSKLAGSLSGFAALKSDGTAISWGLFSQNHTAVPGLLVDLVDIFSANSGFYALKSNGSLVGWGTGGGEIGAVNAFSSEFQNFSKIINAGSGTYVGIRSDGKIVGWGSRIIFSDDLINTLIKGNQVKDVFNYERSLVFILENGAIQVY